MGKIPHPYNPAIVEQDTTEPSMKKQRVGEQSSAALTLLLLRDGLSADPIVNHTHNGQARPPVVAMQKDKGIHVSVTDDEDEALSHSSIASKRARPASAVVSAKIVPALPLQPLVRRPTLYQSAPFLPEGRPLAAPPQLRMPRGFVLRQPVSK